MFKQWQLISTTTKKVIVFYGPSGHGKGLVDVMSGLCVKGPLRRAVITNDFSYKTSEDIHSYLCDLFQDDLKKCYYVITNDKIF